MILVLEIAAGIILAGAVLAFLPIIIPVIFWGLYALLLIALLGGAVWLISYSNAPPIVVLGALGIVATGIFGAFAR